MPRPQRAILLLILVSLLSQVSAAKPLWRLDIQRNEPRNYPTGPHIANDAERVFYLQEGHVKAINGATGKPLWTFRIGRGAQLKYGAGSLLAITARGKLHALEPATGRIRWTSDKELPGIYTVAHRTLYIANVEKLSAVNLETGKVQWSSHVTLFSFSPSEPFTVAEKRIFVYSVSGDVVMSATTYIFDERTGKTLGRANTRGLLAIVKGNMFFQNDRFPLDFPDDVLIDVYDLQTGKKIEERTYTIENRNFPEGSYSGSEVRMDSHAIYISGGGNLACFPLANPRRKVKPDFIRVPEGEVRRVAGPYRGTFVLEWQNAVWFIRQRGKPCTPLELQKQGHKLSSGRVAGVTRAGNKLYIGLRNGGFYVVGIGSGQTVPRLELPKASFGPARTIGDRLIIQTGSELRAFDLP